MGRSRLFWRLFVTYGGLAAAAIGVLGLVVVWRVERYEICKIEETLQARGVLVREIVRGWPDDPRRLQAIVTTLRSETTTRITLIAADGEVLADSDRNPYVNYVENHGSRSEVVQARETGRGSDSRLSDTVHEPMMYVALRSEGTGPVVFVRVALPLNVVQAQLTALRRILWSGVAVAALAALGLALSMARRISRPLQELTRATAHIEAGQYGHKVYVPDRDEFGALANTFNRMSEHLAGQFAQLEEDRQQLRAILGAMIEGVIAVDAGQRILFVNDRAAALLDFPSVGAVGRRLWEVVRRRPIQEIVQCAMAEGRCCCQEVKWSGPGAQNLVVHVAQLEGAPSRGAVLVLHDTSELRRLERLRQDFVANVSHELKTPLSVVKACVETLLDGAADDPEHRGSFLQQIAEQADRLHALILDLLSLARIEAGTETFDFAPVPLGLAIAACVERHRARAEVKNQTLEEVAPAGDDPVAWADEEAVAQILDNLVDNALKYTPTGGRVTIRWWSEDGQAGVEVADTGIGIPEHDLPRVFERFYRVDKARARELGGTGLGLSIVKHLVQALKGTVQAASQVGRGSTFTVRLPLAAPNVSPPRQQGV